jgi:hypothetical protein
MKRMKRLRITHHSALILGLRRVLWIDSWRAGRPRPPRPVIPTPVVPTPQVEKPPGEQSNGGIAQSYILWLLIGLVLLGIIAAMAVADGSKGGLQAVNIPNVPYFLAALVAVAAVSLHIFTFRKWILPYLNIDGFAPTRFGDATITMGFYRTVWNFFTVAWLGTLVLLFFFAFGDIIPYVTNIVSILITYWIGILIVMFLVTALSIGPGDSYIKTMFKAFQWVFVLVLVILMYWGTKV